MNKPECIFLVSLLLALVLASGCVQQAPSQTGQPASSQAAVAINGFAFDPQTVIIKTGGTVTWTNEASVSHTVTAAGLFDSGILGNGQSFSHTFSEAGTFDYGCTIHPSMKGKVIVEG